MSSDTEFRFTPKEAAMFVIATILCLPGLCSNDPYVLFPCLIIAWLLLVAVCVAHAGLWYWRVASALAVTAIMAVLTDRAYSVSQELPATKSDLSGLKNDLDSHLATPDSYSKPIASARLTATFNVKDTSPHFGGGMGIGGTVGFGSGNTAVLIGGTNHFGSSQAANADGSTTFQIDCDASVESPLLGRSASELLQAKYIEVYFPLMKANQTVVSGTVVCVINNAFILRFNIPSQTFDSQQRILIRDLSEGLSPLRTVGNP